MMELVVCCDDLTIRKWLNEVIEGYSTLHHAVMNVSIFSDGKNLISRMDGGYRFHIVILDILAGTGTIGPPDMDLPKKIRTYDTNCLIIFIAESAEYALWGYTVHAFDYWIKPLDQDKVSRSIAEAACFLRENNRAMLPIRSKGISTPVRFANIVYIESVKHHLRIHLVDGCVHQVYGKLDDYEQRLKTSALFLRCHQSFLINMDQVTGICGRDFIMTNGSKVPIRKSASAKTKAEYYRYATGKGG